MGSSDEKEGLPPNPIIIIIAVIRAALDHKEVSLHRLQAWDLHKDISQIEKQGGATKTDLEQSPDPGGLPGHSAKYRHNL